MSFDFDSAIQQSLKDVKSKSLFAIVLGASGGGKSSIMGTVPGNALYLYADGETHGPKNAAMARKEAGVKGAFTSICVSVNPKTGVKLTADETLKQTVEILRSRDFLKANKIESICFDGASEYETIIRSSKQWSKACETSKGEHNGFAEPAATNVLFREVMNEFLALKRDMGMNIVISCALDVRAVGGMGEVMDAAPRLVGYAVAETLIRQFDDVLVVGRMSNGEQVKHKLQFLTEVNKTSKDAKTGAVKKTVNFAPRISGVSVSKLPDIMDADLSKVLELKE